MSTRPRAGLASRLPAAKRVIFTQKRSKKSWLKARNRHVSPEPRKTVRPRAGCVVTIHGFRSGSPRSLVSRNSPSVVAPGLVALTG